LEYQSRVSPELKAALKSRALSSNGATNANLQLVKLVPLSRRKVPQTTASDLDQDTNDTGNDIDHHENCDVGDDHETNEGDEQYVPVSAPRSLDEMGFDDDDDSVRSEDEHFTFTPS
jgi:hypothetical protein